MHDKILLITAFCYLVAMVLLYVGVAHGTGRKHGLAAIVTLLGVLMHGWAQSQHWMASPTAMLSMLNVLSLCALVTVAVPLMTLPFRNNIFDASMVTLPLAIVILLAEAMVQTPSLGIAQGSVEINIHIMTSIIAFGVLSIAGVYALFGALIDNLLRKHRFNRLVETLPALETIEHLMFLLITGGFIILTISLATGLIWVDDVFGQHLAHKTLLSIFAWLVFAVLLWGRWRRGWRGRVAVRMTLIGITLLLLSYFGSKFILEVVLQRSWHS